MSPDDIIRALRSLLVPEDEEVHMDIAREIFLETLVVTLLVVTYGIVWPRAAHFLHLGGLIQKVVFTAHEFAILIYSLHSAFEIAYIVVLRWKTRRT